jgi:hypothetical protein
MLAHQERQLFYGGVTQRSNAFGKVECAQREATRAFALPIKR